MTEENVSKNYYEGLENKLDGITMVKNHMNIIIKMKKSMENNLDGIIMAKNHIKKIM